MKFYLFIDGD